MKNKHTLIMLALLATLLMVLTGCASKTPSSPGDRPVPATTTTIQQTDTPEPVPTPTAPPKPANTPAPTPVRTPTDIPAFTKNLAYTISLAPAVLAQKLDVYTPGREQKDGWPVVVVAHGFMQKKRDFKTLSEKIAEQGAAVFAVDWPTYTGVSQGNGEKLREMTETLVCAVRYADAHAAEYGGDPDRIILLGFSLGAGMGGLVSLGGDTLEVEWETLAEQSGKPIDQIDCVAPEGSAHVDAFVGIAGPYGILELQDDNPDLRAIVAPSEQLGENPDLIVRLLHGEIDAKVPVESSMALHDALLAAGYDVTFTLFDEGHKVPHGLTLETIAEVVDNLSTE